MNILTRLTRKSIAKEMEMADENDDCDLSDCKPSITLVDSCGREFFTNLLPRDMDFLIKYSIIMRAKQEAAEELLYGPKKKKIREEKVKERKIKVEECSPEIPLPHQPKQMLRIPKKDLFSTQPTSKRVPKPNRKYLEIPGPIPIDEANSPPESPEWESIDLSTAEIPPRIRRTFLGTKIPATPLVVKRGKYKTKKSLQRLEQTSPEIPQTSKPYTLLDSLRCDEVLDSPGNSQQSVPNAFEDRLLVDNGRRGMPPTSDDHNYATKIPRTMKLSRRQAGYEDIPPPLPKIRIPRLKIKPSKMKKLKLGKLPKVHGLPVGQNMRNNEKLKALKEGRHGCRREYGIERQDQWCKHCQWKKACIRFGGREGRIIVPEPEHVVRAEKIAIERLEPVVDKKSQRLLELDRKKAREEFRQLKVKLEETHPEALLEVKPIMKIDAALTPVPTMANTVQSKGFGFGAELEVEEKKEIIKTEMKAKEKQKIPLLIPLTLEPPAKEISSAEPSSDSS